MKQNKLVLLFGFLFFFVVHQTSYANTNFSDVPAQYTELQEAVTQLNNANIVYGYADGTFKPNEAITREQFAVILARTLKLDTRNNKSPFPDVKTDEIYSGSIHKLTTLGIINGFPDGTFKPKQLVTRIQAATMLHRAFNLTFEEDGHFFTDVAADNTYVKALYFNGITTGTTETTFGPNVPITRGQASIFIYRLLQMNKRANVLYLKEDSIPITAIRIVEQSNDAVRLVQSTNGLRMIPNKIGTGQFILKGLVRETTVPIEDYIAYTYEVTLQNGKLHVNTKEVELSEVVQHVSHFYSYETLHLTFIPTSVQVTNHFQIPVKEELYYIGKNESGLEIAFFEPGKYTITLSNNTETMHLQAVTTIQDSTTVTTLMYE